MAYDMAYNIHHWMTAASRIMDLERQEMGEDMAAVHDKFILLRRNGMDEIQHWIEDVHEPRANSKDLAKAPANENQIGTGHHHPRNTSKWILYTIQGKRGLPCGGQCTVFSTLSVCLM
eukprot:TCONS_00042207-protein